MGCRHGLCAASLKPSNGLPPAPKAGKVFLAFAVDFAAVKLGAFFLVTDDFIGLVGLGEFLLGLRVILVLVRVIFLRKDAIGLLDFRLACALFHPQNHIRVFHGHSLSSIVQPNLPCSSDCTQYRKVGK